MLLILLVILALLAFGAGAVLKVLWLGILVAAVILIAGFLTGRDTRL